jgi:aminocarboxymuconate-semialdehyde decarboxylase
MIVVRASWIVFTHHQLEYLVDQYGADHVLVGTDYPADMG